MTTFIWVLTILHSLPEPIYKEPCPPSWGCGGGVGWWLIENLAKSENIDHESFLQPLLNPDTHTGYFTLSIILDTRLIPPSVSRITNSFMHKLIFHTVYVRITFLVFCSYIFTCEHVHCSIGYS